MAERQLAVIEVKPGAAGESQSGLQMMRPRIYGAFDAASGAAGVAAIVMHPTSNFMGHYLIAPLAARGVTCMGLNSRYVGSDAALLMERVIQDLGAGVAFLRARGYERVVLVGNSGGAALASFYQAEAEQLTIADTPAGDPIALAPGDLPPVDGIALAAAHAGRSRIFREWIDPSVVDEADPLAADPALDVYDDANGPPFAADFLARFAAGQAARAARLEAWVWARLRALRANCDGPQDQAFTIYRTHADPRLVDLSIDTNDRAPGGIWGDPRTVNYAANSMARYCSLTGFLSQWASCSRADGPTNLARTTVPVLLLEYTADASTFPSTAAAWRDAAGRRLTEHPIPGANHYLKDQPDLVDAVADHIADWARAL